MSGKLAIDTLPSIKWRSIRSDSEPPHAKYEVKYNSVNFPCGINSAAQSIFTDAEKTACFVAACLT